MSSTQSLEFRSYGGFKLMNYRKLLSFADIFFFTSNMRQTLECKLRKNSKNPCILFNDIKFGFKLDSNKKDIILFKMH